MFDALLMMLFPAIYGQGLSSALQEMTGVSSKTWRTPTGPTRPSTIAKAQSNMVDWVLRKLQDDGGYSEDEAKEICAFHMAHSGKEGPFTSLVRMFSHMGEFEWPHTGALAQEIDTFAGRLHELRASDDLKSFRCAVLLHMETGANKAWADSRDEYGPAVEEANNASEWTGLAKITVLWSVSSICQLLSCWDVEFSSAYLYDKSTGRGLKPQPVFLLLLPLMNPAANANSAGVYPARGLFHLPLRRLLKLCFCLAHYHREESWPPERMVVRTHIAAWGGQILQGDGSEQPVAKIHAGSRGLSKAEFLDVWVSMCGEDAAGISPVPPWPCYAAAQLWACLLTRRDAARKDSPVTEMSVLDPEVYRYWWNHYYQEFLAKEIGFGTAPWPAYLYTD